MGKTVISVEHLSKRYDLGVIGTGTIRRDLNRWWARLRGNPDPYTKIGEIDYGNRQGESILALDDVSFKVEQGEVLGIIGSNGAGKSTLLKILSQVTAPTSGEAKIKGRIGSLLEVGTGFHQELTGRENIFLNGAILGMTQVEVARKFDEIVDFSGVEKFIDTPVKRYSSGMYVRLAFAVAAHLDPEILIVDEVLAVGDAEFQKKCLGKMGEVAHEGRTVLFVSHNLNSIRQLCCRGIVLESGKVGIDDDILNSLTFYSNSYDEFIFNVKKRYGNGKATIQSLVINNNKKVTCGKNFELCFEIQAETYLPKVNIGFSIHDSNGKVLAIIYSEQSTDISLYKGTSNILVRIDNFPFTPGTYSIRARIESHRENLDFPEGDIIKFYAHTDAPIIGIRPEQIQNGLTNIMTSWKYFYD